MRCKLKYEEVIWEGPDGTRTPEEKEREYPFCMFRVGPFLYLHPRQLMLIPTGRKGVYRDSYGHKVFVDRKRFPCFDSHDYANEKRHSRDAYLVCCEKLYCVHWEDGSFQVDVYSDVDQLDSFCCEFMRRAGLVDSEGYLLL